MPTLIKKNLRRVRRFDLTADTYVNLVELSARDVLDLQARYGDRQGTDNVRFAADVLARALVDDDGARLYDDGDDVLANLPGGDVALFGKLADAAVEHAGLVVPEGQPKN